MQDICGLLKIGKVKATAYHPQCNPMVEHFNQTLIAQLKKYTADDPDSTLYSPTTPCRIRLRVTPPSAYYEAMNCT
uniref:Integrase catalytic domain-containing protein n=1 Tax=Romanomermis culicivorax TaxID=13658 RepID=A0A915J1B1_ROMCU